MSKDRGEKGKDKGAAPVEKPSELGAPDARQETIPGTPAFVSIHTMREQYITLRKETERLENQIAIRIKANKNKPFAIGDRYYVSTVPKDHRGSKDPSVLRLKEKKARKASAAAEY